MIWQAEDVLRVPANAVFRHGDGWAVYRVANGLAELVEVETGRRNGLHVQIEDGLSEGDRVIAHPSDRVRDGVEVERR